MQNSFLRISALLTGFENLRPELSNLYFAQLQEAFKAPMMALLNAYESKITGKPGGPGELFRTNIWNDPAMKPICTLIINLWYTARFDSTNILPGNPVKWIAPEEAYFESLLWKAVEAHPPALSGGYVGYWRYAPEN